MPSAHCDHPLRPPPPVRHLLSLRCPHHVPAMTDCRPPCWLQCLSSFQQWSPTGALPSSQVLQCSSCVQCQSRLPSRCAAVRVLYGAHGPYPYIFYELVWTSSSLLIQNNFLFCTYVSTVTWDLWQPADLVLRLDGAVLQALDVHDVVDIQARGLQCLHSMAESPTCKVRSFAVCTHSLSCPPPPCLHHS